MRLPRLFALAITAAFAAFSVSLAPALAAPPAIAPDPASFMPRPIEYARVPNRVPVFRTLDDVRAGASVTSFGGANYFVSAAAESATVNGVAYRRATWGWGQSGWFAGSALSFDVTLSRLQGVDLKERPGSHAVITNDPLNVRAAPGDGQIVGQLPRWQVVEVLDTRAVGATTWLRIGTDRWISGDFARRFEPGQRPAGVGANQRWIEVNLTTQTMYAHEGDTPVYATLVATGRPGYETVTGLFRIQTRNETAPMTWESANPPYSYSDVPYIMYFFGDYAIHGQYWHDAFGAVRSAGCVNLSLADAKWFFDFASIGTPVFVRR